MASRQQVLDDLTAYVSSYLLAAGVSHVSFTAVRDHVRALGGQFFSDYASFSAIPRSLLSGLVAHVQGNLGLFTSAPGAHLSPTGLRTGDDQGPGSGLFAAASEHWLVRMLRDGTFGRLDSDRRPSGRSNYADLVSGGDLNGVTMANYRIHQLTREIFNTGMSYNTFNWMRSLPGENFNATHIRHAGEDARRYGFHANDRDAVRNLGILSRDDGDRRQQRHDLMAAYGRRLESDEELNRLRRQRDAATGEERARLERLMVERDRAIQQELGIGAFANQAPTEASQRANQQIFDHRFRRWGGIGQERSLQLTSQLEDQDAGTGNRNLVVQGGIIAQPPRPGPSAPITAQDRAIADAASGQTEDQTLADVASLRRGSRLGGGQQSVVVQLPPGVQNGPT